MVRVFLSLAALAWTAAACDQNMSDTPLPEASPAELARLASRLSEAPSLSVPAGSSVSGVIELAPRLAALTAPSDVVYVIARRQGSDSPPLAVERLTGNAYPMRFVLDMSAASGAGVASGPLQLVVKVDKDGDVETSSERDLLGFTTSDVTSGESGVSLAVQATLGELDAAIARARSDSSRVAISGTIILPEGLAGRTSPEDVVYVIARRPGVAAPPVAVVRLSGNRYPLRFVLDEDDRMLDGDWPEALELEVRVDKDGDPLTRGPADLTGRPPAAVRLGEQDVRIRLGG